MLGTMRRAPGQTGVEVRMKEPYGERRWLRSVLQGYFNYHAVPGNLASLNSFRQQGSKRWLRSLRRRGQKRPMT